MPWSRNATSLYGGLVVSTRRTFPCLPGVRGLALRRQVSAAQRAVGVPSVPRCHRQTSLPSCHFLPCLGLRGMVRGSFKSIQRLLAAVCCSRLADGNRRHACAVRCSGNLPAPGPTPPRPAAARGVSDTHQPGAAPGPSAGRRPGLGLRPGRSHRPPGRGLGGEDCGMGRLVRPEAREESTSHEVHGAGGGTPARS